MTATDARLSKVFDVLDELLLGTPVLPGITFFFKEKELAKVQLSEEFGNLSEEQKREYIKAARAISRDNGFDAVVFTTEVWMTVVEVRGGRHSSTQGRSSGICFVLQETGQKPKIGVAPVAKDTRTFDRNHVTACMASTEAPRMGIIVSEDWV